MSKRLLITGGSSYVGQHLVLLASADYDITYTYFSRDPLTTSGFRGQKLDMRNHEAVLKLVREVRPEAIINLAGSNRVDDMQKVIEEGAQAITVAAAEVNARLIHISTDVIFDGCHAPYKEESTPNPLHEYGQAKATAERIVQRWANHVIVRTSLIYGLSRMDRSTEWIAMRLRQGETVNLFTDQMRNPVWVMTLCEACLELLEHPYRGILHVAGSQVMSRAELGQKLLDWWKVTPRETLVYAPCPAEAPWPLNTTLDLSKAKQILQTRLMGVDDVFTLQSSVS